MPNNDPAAVRVAYPNLTDAEVERIASCVNLARQVVGSEPVDFVLSNVVAGEEVRWTSLWLVLASGAVMEFFSFMPGGRFDYVPRAGIAVRRVAWEIDSYDFANATEASRLKLDVSLGGGDLSPLQMTLTAVGSNCDQVWQWARRHVGPLAEFGRL